VRIPAWDRAARADFEARLGRARAGDRQQYLRVKAVMVQEVGEVDGPRTLLRRVVDLPGGHAHEVAFATEALGALAARDGDHDHPVEPRHEIVVERHDEPTPSHVRWAAARALSACGGPPAGPR
jgi:hypothetical protein